MSTKLPTWIPPPSLALYLSPLHSSVICLLHVHPNLQELNGLCSKKSDRASKKYGSFLFIYL
jgi:hypothetical protein